MEISEEDFAAAEARMAARREAGYVTSALYDPESGKVVLVLSTLVEVAFPAAMAEGLAGASDADLSNIEVSPSGLGLHWPALDADLYVPSILQGILGSRRWMARQLGAVGGKSASPAKVAAARANGKRGGRPPKRATG